MVIKVDFDLTMSILSHNLYRVLANDLTGYEHNTPQTLYEKFINNNGSIEINHDSALISMKKKRNLPELLTAMKKFEKIKVPWFGDRTLTITAASNT